MSVIVIVSVVFLMNVACMHLPFFYHYYYLRHYSYGG